MENKKSHMQRFVNWVEITGGILLGFVALLMFVSVVTRYLFTWPIPDGFAFGNMLLGIAIFWGIASATYHLEHIKVDIVYETMGRRGKKVLNFFAAIISLIFFLAVVWGLGNQIFKVLDNDIYTSDLEVRIWPFYLVACTGGIMTVAILCIMLWRYLTKRNA